MVAIHMLENSASQHLDGRDFSEKEAVFFKKIDDLISGDVSSITPGYNSWDIGTCDKLVEDFLSLCPEYGLVDKSISAKLISRISRNGVIVSIGCFDFLLRVIDEAEMVHFRLLDFAYQQILTVLDLGQGPLRQITDFRMPTVSMQVTNVVRRLLIHSPLGNFSAVSADEFHYLDSIYACNYFEKDNPYWDMLYCSAAISYVGRLSGWRLPGRERLFAVPSWGQDYLDMPPYGEHWHEVFAHEFGALFSDIRQTADRQLEVSLNKELYQELSISLARKINGWLSGSLISRTVKSTLSENHDLLHPELQHLVILD